MRRTLCIRGLSCFLGVLLFAMPLFALADDAGVLTEGELNAWVVQILQKSMTEQPQNAPVGEESHTEDGYAFLYSFATLYYDKPVLDQESVLMGFAITNETIDTPRGIRLGAPADELIAAYGWQNSTLFGDGSFAALYTLDQLEMSAYWAWAQIGESGLASVRCAIHAGVGDAQYTDAGVVYQVQAGVVTSIRVYGLSQLISLADVRSNLAAVNGVAAAGSGDDVMENEGARDKAQGNFQKSDAAAFGREDLRFSKIDFLSLKEAGAALIFGQPQSEEWVQDDTGEWLYTTRRDGITLMHVLDVNRGNSRLATLSITKAGLLGPREVKLGDTLESVLLRFRSDGTGAVSEYEALLYGDGVKAPYATLSTEGHVSTLRYVLETQGADGMEREISLHMLFEGEKLTEIMLFTW